MWPLRGHGQIWRFGAPLMSLAKHTFHWGKCVSKRHRMGPRAFPTNAWIAVTVRRRPRRARKASPERGIWAGKKGFEPITYGFEDHCSTS